MCIATDIISLHKKAIGANLKLILGDCFPFLFLNLFQILFLNLFQIYF